MTSSRIVARGRRRMEALMQDTCTITRTATSEDAEWVAQIIDEETGQYPDQGRVVIYTGPCRVQIKADINANVIEVNAGEREWTYSTATLQLPVAGTEDVRVDNIAEILTAAHDSELVGRKYNVQGMYHKSDSVHRRLRIREVIA